jgi:3-dehydroquinate dehydratase-2
VSLKLLRSKQRSWKLQLIDGPNMSNLGRRDRRLFGAIGSIDELHRQVGDLAAELGVEIETFVSNFEGDILERIHKTAATCDAYIVNPGGLTTVSEGMRHALQETRRPVIEVHFHNLAASSQVSVFSPSVLGMCMGLRQYSYLAAVLGLVLALDDDSFLGEGQGETVRRDGTPYSFVTSATRR